MHLKIQQSDIWKFNRAWNEKSLVFSLKITDSEWNIISQRNDEWKEIKAILKTCRKDEDDGNLEYIKYEYESLFNDFQINKLLQLADLTNYEDESILFFKTVKENYEEIRSNFIESIKESINKKIEKLNNELNNLSIREDEEITLEWVEKKLDNYRIRYEAEEKKLKDCIEWSETYKQTLDLYQKWKSYYDDLLKKVS